MGLDVRVVSARFISMTLAILRLRGMGVKDSGCAGVMSEPYGTQLKSLGTR